MLSVAVGAMRRKLFFFSLLQSVNALMNFRLKFLKHMGMWFTRNKVVSVGKKGLVVPYLCDVISKQGQSGRSRLS